jgi:hypothetical protein
MNFRMKNRTGLLIMAVAATMSACKKNSDSNNSSEIVLANHSTTPSLVKKLSGFENLDVYSLIGSDDVLTGSPNFVFGGSADGSGLLKNADGTYSFLVNHEDNFAVSRITLDKSFKPTKGEYILNSTGGTWRLCSATMATQAEHGFGPLFLTSGESGEESRTHGINPLETNFNANTSKELPGLGRTSAENAVPLNKNAYPGKTIILIGDDDSGAEGGQVLMYVSNTVGDLVNGKLYTLRRKDANIKERDMLEGTGYDVEFVEIPNASTLTGRQLQLAAVGLNSIRFGRVEDLDYGKGNAASNRDIYFNVTGQATTGANADFSRTKYGRVYKLSLDATNPLAGRIECILDGDNRTTGKAKDFQNPDNILVTQNYVYIQEDANSYGDETHDAYIYQYNIATKELKKVFELDHRRTATDAAKYNVGGTSTFGSWEYGSMIDISDIISVPNTFMLCVQPHTWRGDKYKGVDGGSVRPTENQASQILIIKGLQK